MVERVGVRLLEEVPGRRTIPVEFLVELASLRDDRVTVLRGTVTRVGCRELDRLELLFERLVS